MVQTQLGSGPMLHLLGPCHLCFLWVAPFSGFQQLSLGIPDSFIMTNAVLSLTTSYHQLPQRGEVLYCKTLSKIPWVHSNWSGS